MVADDEIHVDAVRRQLVHEEFPSGTERMKVDELASIHEVAHVNDAGDASFLEGREEHLVPEADEVLKEDGAVVTGTESEYH